MIYKTAYKYKNQALASYVRAPNSMEAKELLRRRGLGEYFNDNTPLQKRYSAVELFKGNKSLDCLHWVTFGSVPLINAGYRFANEFLWDGGIIHRLIHEIMRLKYSKKKEKKYKKFLDGERRELIEQLKEFDRNMRKLGY